MQYEPTTPITFIPCRDVVPDGTHVLSPKGRDSTTASSRIEPMNPFGVPTLVGSDWPSSRRFRLKSVHRTPSSLEVHGEEIWADVLSHGFPRPSGGPSEATLPCPVQGRCP